MLKQIAKTSILILCLIVNSSIMASVPLKVIFDTDMGNDIDDALALDMLYKFMDEGRIELLGITSNKEELESVEYIDILNNFYGYPDIPIGRITHGAPCDYENSFTAQIAADSTYTRSYTNYTELPESCELLRRILVEQPNCEIVIIAVGFSTNLQRLLASSPDDLSPLGGRELIRRKVKHLYMMAGEFEHPKGKRAEYNIRIDPNTARNIFNHWPTPITVCPFEVGDKNALSRDFHSSGFQLH